MLIYMSQESNWDSLAALFWEHLIDLKHLDSYGLLFYNIHVASIL